MTDNPQQSDLFGSRRKPQRRWIEAAERRAARKAAFDALPEEERAVIWARIDRLLFIEAKWIRAKSPEYADNPHSYCRRRDFQQDQDFRWLITMIREGGIGTRRDLGVSAEHAVSVEAAVDKAVRALRRLQPNEGRTK